MFQVINGDQLDGRRVQLEPWKQGDVRRSENQKYSPVREISFALCPRRFFSQELNCRVARETVSIILSLANRTLGCTRPSASRRAPSHYEAIMPFFMCHSTRHESRRRRRRVNGRVANTSRRFAVEWGSSPRCFLGRYGTLEITLDID